MEAVIDGMLRKLAVVFLARETFLLRRGDDVTINDEGRGRVVVEGGNTEYGRHPEESLWWHRGMAFHDSEIHPKGTIAKAVQYYRSWPQTGEQAACGFDKSGLFIRTA